MNPQPVLPFTQKLRQSGLTISRMPLETLQLNIGKLCNLACLHCHVEAGPKRTENMDARTADRFLELLDHNAGIRTLDITGGAPEMNPHFRRIVARGRSLGMEVIDRCNLSVFYLPGQEDTPAFLREHQVRIIASLPCYSKDNVDKQRGRGVFNESIEALKLLNSLGYGKSDPMLRLDLVYNPLGDSLPPEQAALELSYKRELRELFDIEFHSLFAITNMPIKRFLHQLQRENKLAAYMELLANSFNPRTAEQVMCRSVISVSWDGFLFDCDFNQMLEIPLGLKQRRTIWEIDSFAELAQEPIAFANHCYGCTAGAGSSCTGTLS